VVDDVCSKVLTLSTPKSVEKEISLLSSPDLKATLHLSTSTSTSSGWNVLSIIGMVGCGCVLVVGLLVIVIQSKRQKSSASSTELDQRSLMSKDVAQRNHGGLSPVENAQLPLVSGFVSRR
jgi:beta-lactamase regulating signal transducer with metallopeptidase domain